MALADLQSRASTSVYSRWYRGIISSFDKLECPRLLVDTVHVNTSKGTIKKLVCKLWLKEGGASVEDIEGSDKLTSHLRYMHNDDPNLDTIRSVKMNILSTYACNISFRTQVMDSYNNYGLGIG